MLRKFIYFTFVLGLCGFANATTVSRIDVRGNQRMDAESVRILSNVKVGDNINSEQVNGVAKKLQASGYFSSVDVGFNDGVLKINLTEAPIINMVTVEGNDEIDTEDLKKEIKTKERAAYDISVIGGDVQRMLTLYQRKGFFGTKINPKKIELDNNRVNVVYEINEGHPTYIKDIDFENNKKFRSSVLRGEILSREHAWWRFMTQFDVYDEDRIQYDQQMLHQFYMRNGFLDFKITNVKGEFSPDREYYSVKFTVDEGNQYKIGNITIDNPFDDVPTKELKDALTISRKDVYNIDEIDATMNALRGVVADHGYAFINVEPVPTKNDDTRVVDLNFKIQKTNRIYINNINLLGNVRTFDNVIEHHLPMREGDPFSLQTIETGRQNLMRTRYFKDVQMVPTRLADANMMNLDVKVEEQKQSDTSKKEEKQKPTSNSKKSTSTSSSNNVDNTTTYQQPSQESTPTPSQNNEVQENTTPSSNQTNSYVGVPDPNNFNYSMHHGVIEYSTEQSCIDASYEIGFKDTVDIINSFCYYHKRRNFSNKIIK